MVASAHDNLSFEVEAADADPMEPALWAVAVTSTGEEAAEWDATGEAVEDFEEGWHDAIASLAPASDPYASPHALVSQVGPFALVDGMTLQVTRDGANLETVQFLEADFLDITAATAAEVAAVMTAALVGFQVDTVTERVRIRSNPFGEAVAVVGTGSANSALGFPLVYEAFAGPELDIETMPWADDLAAEGFANEWAGIPAILVSANKEPFAVSDGDDLDITVNGIPQTVTFAGIAAPGAATADEIAANITAQLVAVGGEAEAEAVADLDVIIRTEALGFGVSLEVTGGTAALALGFYPSAGFAVGDGFFSVLPGNTAALWDVATPEGFEDFEDEWDNDAFAWVLTDEVIRITQELPGVTYMITLVSNNTVEDYEYTAQVGDTITSIADELDAAIDGNSELVSSLELGSGVLRLTRLDNRTEVSVTVSTSTGVNAIEHGAELVNAAISAAPFDVAADDFEDFEEEWSNGDGVWTWLLSTEYVEVLTAVVGRAYAVTLDTGLTATEFSYTAIGGDTVNTIATALGALIDADPRYTAGVIASTINIAPVDSRTPTEPRVSDADDLLYWTNNVGPGVIDAMVFGGAVPATFDGFEGGGAPQFELSFGAADPVPAGVYAFSILGVAFEYTSGGADTRTDMSNEFINQINNSSIRHLVQANLASDDIWLTSISCPKVLLDVSNPSSPSDTLEVIPADQTVFWDDYHTMCTI